MNLNFLPCNLATGSGKQVIFISRKNKLKVSNEELRQYLLDNYITEEGSKVSDRYLWATDEFMDYTGLYKEDILTGRRKPVSTGTISYWKKKLNILEEDVFRYHQLITGKIKEEEEYETWSKKYNKGHERVQILTQETIKRRLIKHVGLSKTFYNFSFDDVSMAVANIWNEMGLDSTAELNKFYATLYAPEESGD